MLLYLVQHGEAESQEKNPARGLTDKGMRDVRTVSATVQKMKLRVSQIFHSGKTRASQSAQIIANYLKPEKGVSETDGLAPMDDPTIWAERVSGMSEDIMLVGHLPHLAKLAGLLLCEEKVRMIIDFKMGGMVCLQRFDDGRWAVEWIIVPEIC